ncbi:MAG: serine/threonine-protein kinase [Planctomycetota bacterium]|nr:serine/threonine-protein kinase [Planctomycetota bacterium]
MSSEKPDSRQEKGPRPASAGSAPSAAGPRRPDGPSRATTFCSHCNHRNRQEASSCAACGRRLASGGSLALASDPRNLLGKIINGKYKVLSVLGEGGMGVVYKVQHLILQNRNLFALKILHPRFSGDEHFRNRFMQEVEVVMDLTHENIVQIREFGITEDDFLFFTMDYFEGSPLSQALAEKGRFTVERAVQICRSLLGALAEAHRSGVVHRDLKPDNVLIQTRPRGDRVCILDFGVAKVLEGDRPGLTQTNGGIIGTPKYMSPEQAAGGEVDGRSDLYALGVLLYELVSGKSPFARETARLTLLAQMNAAPPPFKEVAPKVKIPPLVETFIFRLLEKDPRDRPASASECLAILDGKRGSTRERRARKARRRAMKRRSTVRWPFLAAVLALGVGIFWLASNRPDVLRPIPRGFAEGWRALSAEAPAATSGRSTDDHGATGTPFAGDPRPPRPSRSSVPPESPRRWLYRCELCGTVYEDKDEVFNRCHGEPMTEIPAGD